MKYCIDSIKKEHKKAAIHKKIKLRNCLYIIGNKKPNGKNKTILPSIFSDSFNIVRDDVW